MRITEASLCSAADEEFIRKVKELGYQVKLDTNGSKCIASETAAEHGLGGLA